MKKTVLVIMVILGLVIVISNIGVSYFMLTSITMYSVEKGIEGTIITNGLTIISLAITVWLGISIYNAIDKNEIAELKSTLEKYSPLSEQVREYNKQQLVNQMYKVGDISCDYIAKRFDKDSEIPIDRYADLLTIDILLQRTYEAEDEYLKRKWANTGIEKINKYKGKFKKRFKLEDLYLNYREGDFWFYIGNDCNDGADKFNACKKAKMLFIQSLTDFEISLSLDGEMPIALDEERLRLSVYFANAIGQCVANMIYCQLNTDSELEELISEAHRYLEFAVKHAKKDEEREQYYRNYGCLIENTAVDIKDYEKAYIQYKMALRIYSKNRKTYHVLISNLNKRIRAMLGIEMREPNKNRKKSLVEISFTEINDKMKIVELIEEMKIFIDLATRVIPDNANWYAFSIYRKLYMLCVQNCLGNSQNKKYLHSMKQDMKKIQLLNGQTDLCIVAQMEVTDLDNYISNR